jgi:hypothetical protein
MEALSVDLGTSAEKRASALFHPTPAQTFDVVPCSNRRSRPYGAGVVPTRDLPPRSRTPVPSQSHAHPSESATAARTLNSIIPAIVQNPEAFRESIPTICAEHNINPTILESLVQNLESAQLVGNPPKDTDM